MKNVIVFVIIAVFLMSSIVYAEDIGIVQVSSDGTVKAIDYDRFVIKNPLDYFIRMFLKKPYTIVGNVCPSGSTAKSDVFSGCFAQSWRPSPWVAPGTSGGYFSCTFTRSNDPNCYYSSASCDGCFASTGERCNPSWHCVPESQPSTCKAGQMWSQDCADGCGKTEVRYHNCEVSGGGTGGTTCTPNWQCTPESQPSDCEVGSTWYQTCIDKNGCETPKSNPRLCEGNTKLFDNQINNRINSQGSGSIVIQGNEYSAGNAILDEMLDKIKDVLGLGGRQEVIIVIILGIGILFILMFAGGRKQQSSIIVVGGHST